MYMILCNTYYYGATNNTAHIRCYAGWLDSKNKWNRKTGFVFVWKSHPPTTSLTTTVELVAVLAVNNWSSAQH